MQLLPVRCQSRHLILSYPLSVDLHELGVDIEDTEDGCHREEGEAEKSGG